MTSNSKKTARPLPATVRRARRLAARLLPASGPSEAVPAKKAPATKAPGKKALATNAPGKKAPGKKAAADAQNASAENAPATKAPGKKAPAKKAPGKKAAAKKGADRAARRIDPRYVAAWSRLARAVLAEEIEADPQRLDRSITPAAARKATLQAGMAPLAEALAAGESIEAAVRRAVVALGDRNLWNAAWSLAEGLGRQLPDTTASVVGHAVRLHRRREFGRIWRLVEALDDKQLAQHLPIEAVDGAFAAGTRDARRRALHIASLVDLLDSATVVDLAGRFLAYDEWDAAGELIAELRSRPPVELDERTLRSQLLIETWLQRRPKQVPDGAVPVAVIDYQTPDQDLASGNLGDYVQTLSLLGNLTRFSGVRFSGENGLGELAGELQARTRADLQVSEPAGRVHLLDINREFSSGDLVPEGTWMFAFGWHMHPLYDLRYDFPYHPNLRPLFLSFHLNRLDMLTDEACDYLRAHAPVGCRDWTTVGLLLDAGIDAFFSGCLTTTVDAVFPSREEAYAGDDTVGLIDITREAAEPVPAVVREYTHQADEYRHMTMTDGVRAAVDVLAAYQRDLARAVTTRLHAYLPLTALGIPVDFRPWAPGDVRFPGLSGLRHGGPELAQLQAGIRELIATTLAAMVSGADRDEVYALWRGLTAHRVEEAKALFAQAVSDGTPRFDIGAAVAASLAGARPFGPHDAVEAKAVTDVVLSFDENLLSQAAVTVESMLANASGPLRLTILCRGLDATVQQQFAATFPSLPITFVPCDHADYGRVARIPARITVSTMDRLLLPHLLDDVSRVVYLDVDTLVLGDICELGRVDLRGHAVAARDSNVSEATQWRNAAKRLPEDIAFELQRRMGRTDGHSRPALNAGVLVLDLDRLRRQDFTAVCLSWVERYGLHDQDVLLGFTGADRLVLDPRWNALPVLEDVVDPAIIHWAGMAKPWDDALTYGQDLWHEYAARLRDRTTRGHAT